MLLRKLIIGDIHGCSKTLRKLLFEIVKIEKSDIIYFLGDYIDRGPNSKEVLDIILKLIENDYNINPLKGNHEQMLLDSIKNPDNLLLWMKNGAESTLASFKVNKPSDINDKYIHFLENCKYYFELDDYIIVHGGLNFDIDEPLTDTSSMLWTRNEIVKKDKIDGKKIIVGHTPTPLSKVMETIEQDKIKLDAGCVYGAGYIGLGYLCCLELNSKKLYYTLNIDEI